MFRFQDPKNLSLILLLAGLLVLGCGSDDDDDNVDPTGNEDGHPPAAMLGTWVFQSVTVDGVAASLADVLEWLPATVRAEINIQTNGTYVFQEVNASGGQLWWESGFVYVSGNEIDINTLQDGDGLVNETSYLTYTLVNGILTLIEVDEGITVVFILTMDL